MPPVICGSLQVKGYAEARLIIQGKCVFVPLKAALNRIFPVVQETVTVCFRHIFLAATRLSPALIASFVSMHHPTMQVTPWPLPQR